MVELKEPWGATKTGLGELLGKQNQAKFRVKENLEKSVGAVKFCMGHGNTVQRCPSLHVGPPGPHV